MTLHRLLLAAAATLIVSGPAVAEDMPKALLPELIATEHALCHTSVGYGTRFVQFVDLRGDGHRGVLLDYADAMCGGVAKSFCDGSGCLIKVYANDHGGWHKVYDGHARGWQAGQPKAGLLVDGKPLGG